MNIAIVVPARLASSRFPAKLLALIAGRPLIAHAVERVLGSKADQVVVATDDLRIKEAVSGLACRVFMSRGDHSCGTDRVAEAAQEIEADYIINVQGDQLVVGPDTINNIIDMIDVGLERATLYTQLGPAESAQDENIVKVVVGRSGNIIYMSRRPIPFNKGGVGTTYFKQVGIYVFAKQALLEFTALEPTPLEAAEGVELLRAIECDMRVRGIFINAPTQDVDTLADVEAAAEFIAKYPLDGALIQE